MLPRCLAFLLVLASVSAFAQTEIKLTTDDAAVRDYFGYTVSVDGDTAVIGAHYDGDGGTLSGSAYVFSRNLGGADNWGQVAKLTASDAAASDFFGISVSVDGDTAVIGAYRNDDAGLNSGSAYVFSRNQGGADNWGQVVKLTASDAAAGDIFGYSVSVDGDTAVIGAVYANDDGGLSSGSAYVFSRHQGGADNWGQVSKLTADDAARGDSFGNSVSVDGDTAVIGAVADRDAGRLSGSAYVFSRNQGGADNWGQVTKLTASDAAEEDRFGKSVSVDGDTAVIGAYLDGNADSDGGSAYIFFGGVLDVIFRDQFESGL